MHFLIFVTLARHHGYELYGCDVNVKYNNISSSLRYIMSYISISLIIFHMFVLIIGYKSIYQLFRIEWLWLASMWRNRTISQFGPSKYDDILVDIGTNDSFLMKQLLPQRFIDICQEKNQPLSLRMHEGYDHSYYFISSFVVDHVEYHSKYLLE